jgi:hypothetical protein
VYLGYGGAGAQDADDIEAALTDAAKAKNLAPPADRNWAKWVEANAASFRADLGQLHQPHKGHIPPRRDAKSARS